MAVRAKELTIKQEQLTIAKKDVSLENKVLDDVINGDIPMISYYLAFNP